MALTNLQSIEELSRLLITTFDLKFQSLIEGAAKEGNQLTTVIRTDRQGTHLPFTNTWKGLQNLGLYENLQYETTLAQYVTLEIGRKAKGIKCGRFDYKNPITQSTLMKDLDALVAQAGWSRSIDIFHALAFGDTNEITVYDEVTASKPLFATDHTLNGNTYSNLVSGLPLTGDNLNTVKLMFNRIPMGPLDPYGQRLFLPTMGARFTLIIPPDLEIAARNILNDGVIYKENYSSKNPFSNMAELMVNNLLQDTTDWYVLMDLPGLTPFVTLEHVDSNPGLIAKIADTDMNVIERNEYEWSLQIIEKTYPVHYYQMIKVVNS